MNKFRLIGLVVGAIIISILALAAVKPAHFQFERSLVINASAEEIFPFLINSETLDKWMPWRESDPSVHMRFEGPAEGVGSKSVWESSGSMGHGSATISEVIPTKSVTTNLEYTKPMSMKQVAKFTLTPVETGTQVTWSVEGDNGFLGRIFCLFKNMDDMVGPQFVLGLEKLAQLVREQQK